MGRSSRFVGACLVAATLSAIPFERAAQVTGVAEYEIWVSAADGRPGLVVRVAAVSAGSGGERQVFERVTPFSWRVPESTLNLIAQAVTRGNHITVALERPGEPSANLARGTGGTIVLYAGVLTNGHGVIVLP